MSMFASWRAAAGRVEAALGQHEAALRAADDRLARGAQGGFVHRWSELVRHSDRLLNFARLGGGDEPQALAVLARGWSRSVPPRVPRDAAHVRHFLAEARPEVARLEGPERTAPAPAADRPAPARAKRPGYPDRLLTYMQGRASARSGEIMEVLGCDGPEAVKQVCYRANKLLRARNSPRELGRKAGIIFWVPADPGASNTSNNK